MGAPLHPATGFSRHERPRAISAVRIFGPTRFPVYAIDRWEPDVALRAAAHCAAGLRGISSPARDADLYRAFEAKEHHDARHTWRA